MDYQKIYEACSHLKEGMGSSAYWIKDHQKIDMGTDMFHHNCILDLPYDFLDSQTIYDFKRAFNLEDLDELRYNEEFQEECGPEWEELTALVLEKGWIKVRKNDKNCFVTCYDNTNPKYRERVVNAMLDHPDCFTSEISVGDIVGNMTIRSAAGINKMIDYLCS
jgi:hypothetical protein